MVCKNWSYPQLTPSIPEQEMSTPRKERQLWRYQETMSWTDLCKSCSVRLLSSWVRHLMLTTRKLLPLKPRDTFRNADKKRRKIILWWFETKFGDVSMHVLGRGWDMHHLFIAGLPSQGANTKFWKGWMIPPPPLWVEDTFGSHDI